MNIDLSNYIYELPKDKIAKYQLAERDQSKLLIYQNRNIEHAVFHNITDYLPKDSMLVFNNTKVIQARMEFYKSTGARIEIFCLEPENFHEDISRMLSGKNEAKWKCMVGNLKKWKNDEELITINEGISLRARLYRINEKDLIVHFKWNSGNSFTEILEIFGKTPIPPYMNRESEESDRLNYQTVYARKDGAVAAPTAGLHFTKDIIRSLDRKNIKKEYLTLHVGAGTFQPIKNKQVIDHPMHEEQIVFTKKNIENLLDHQQGVISVGTTSLRALESLYWYGVLLSNNHVEFNIPKLYPYEHSRLNISKNESLSNVLEFMTKNNLTEIIGSTSVFIFPGYTFRMIDALITNYHQPGSTLILLVAAFVGKDWRKIYYEALENNYRFLSYGDSSLLFR